MFRQFVSQFVPSIPGGAEVLFRLHPADISGLLEQAWELRVRDQNKPLGHPDRRSDIPGLPKNLLEGFANTYKKNFAEFMGCPDAAINTDRVLYKDKDCPTGCIRWDHLIYAYMIENTCVYEIFRRVLHEFRNGELLGVPIEGSEHWLRNTEELFYACPAPFVIYSLTSNIRPSMDAIRRNAYYRMFGMDLNHGAEDNKPIPYIKAKAANTDFITTFEEFLREVWIAITNVTAVSGPNPTDTAKIADLAEKLYDMMRTRRITGNLAREEFFAVSMMSWFHLTLDYNSSIVLSLRAEATSPEERLKKIAERVNLPSHALSKSFFDMSDAISSILTHIETGIFNDADGVVALFIRDPAQPMIMGQHERDIRTIITHWSITTGRDLRAMKVKPNV